MEELAFKIIQSGQEIVWPRKVIRIEKWKTGNSSDWQNRRDQQCEPRGPAMRTMQTGNTNRVDWQCKTYGLANATGLPRGRIAHDATHLRLSHGALRALWSACGSLLITLRLPMCQRCLVNIVFRSDRILHAADCLLNDSIVTNSAFMLLSSSRTALRKAKPICKSFTKWLH